MHHGNKILYQTDFLRTLLILIGLMMLTQDYVHYRFLTVINMFFSETKITSPISLLNKLNSKLKLILDMKMLFLAKKTAQASCSKKHSLFSSTLIEKNISVKLYIREIYNPYI